MRRLEYFWGYSGPLPQVGQKIRKNHLSTPTGNGRKSRELYLQNYVSYKVRFCHIVSSYFRVLCERLSELLALLYENAMQSTLNATFPQFSRFLFHFISTLRLGLLLTYLAVP